MRMDYLDASGGCIARNGYAPCPFSLGPRGRRLVRFDHSSCLMREPHVLNADRVSGIILVPSR